VNLHGAFQPVHITKIALASPFALRLRRCAGEHPMPYRVWNLCARVLALAALTVPNVYRR
jgi:hypothetical protein